jgi:hypothetical protein
LVDTATVTGRGTLDVDASARNGDFHWPGWDSLVARATSLFDTLTDEGLLLVSTTTRPEHGSRILI